MCFVTLVSVHVQVAAQYTAVLATGVGGGANTAQAVSRVAVVIMGRAAATRATTVVVAFVSVAYEANAFRRGWTTTCGSAWAVGLGRPGLGVHAMHGCRRC